MEHSPAFLAKARSRYTHRVRSLDLPKVYEGFRTAKSGGREPIWFVDGRDHEGERYRLTAHSKAEGEAMAREQQSLMQQQFRLGTSLPMPILVEAAEAHRKGISIRDAVAFFETNRPKTEAVTVSHATEAYVYDREIIQKCGSGVSQMKNIFKRFNAGFGDRFLHELTTKEIENWLLLQQREGGWRHGQEKFDRIGDERRNTVLKLIRALFTFASGKARGWVARDHNPAKDISFIKIERPEPCTLSVEDTAKLLQLVPQFPEDVRAYAYLRIFEPIRRCEFPGLEWEKLAGNNLRVLGKGKRRRAIQLQDVCLAYLKPLIKTSGPILNRHLSGADEYLREAFIAIGLRPETLDDTNDLNPTKNILRHSSCTYLQLLFGAATAARRAGHSEKIQNEHYIGLRTEDEAKRWVCLTPGEVRSIK
jgi:integrase